MHPTRPFQRQMSHLEPILQSDW